MPLGRWFLCFLAVTAALLQSSAWAYVRSAPQGALYQNTTYPVAENTFALESPIGLLCSNDPVNNVDPIGLSVEDPYDNPFYRESVAYRNSPLASERLYGLGIGLVGIPQFIFEGVAYAARIGAPREFARANERILAEEQNGASGLQVIFDRLTGSATGALYGPVLLVANIDQIHKAPGAFIDKVGSDWDSFGSSPFNASYGLIEDATVVYGLTKLAQSSSRLVRPVSSKSPSVPSFRELQTLAYEELDFSTKGNGALFWSSNLVGNGVSRAFISAGSRKC